MNNWTASASIVAKMLIITLMAPFSASEQKIVPTCTQRSVALPPPMSPQEILAHNVACPPRQFMTRFQYRMSINTYNYSCCRVDGLSNLCHQYETDNNKDDLSSVGVSCPKESVLNQFQLARSVDMDLNYAYTCCMLDKLGLVCHTEYTEWTDLLDIGVHNVKCNSNYSVMTSFNLEDKIDEMETQQFRYNYTCCYLFHLTTATSTTTQQTTSSTPVTISSSTVTPRQSATSRVIGTNGNATSFGAKTMALNDSSTASNFTSANLTATTNSSTLSTIIVTTGGKNNSSSHTNSSTIMAQPAIVATNSSNVTTAGTAPLVSPILTHLTTNSTSDTLTAANTTLLVANSTIFNSTDLSTPSKINLTVKII